MNAWQFFVAGISPHHVPALLVAIVAALSYATLRTVRRPATRRGVAATGGEPATMGSPGIADRASPRTGLVDRWVAWLLGVSGVLHVALPLGDRDSAVLVLGFLLGGAAYCWLAWRAATGRSYRTLVVLLVTATLVGYLVVTLGGEEPDQVGIATALDELLALTLCLVPTPRVGRPRRVARTAASVASVAIILAVGLGTWVGAFAAHNAADTHLNAGADQVASATSDTSAGSDEHDHDFAARAQAGIVMRIPETSPPTSAQQAAAARLAAQTKAYADQFLDIHTALSAGYQFSLGTTGYEVHLTRKAAPPGRRVLDPNDPAALVYVIMDGRATLLGSMYQMPNAGEPGPDIGGSITRWHAHNGCATLLPPGVGIMSPFGTCPPLSIQATIPEMMHVWTVANPPGGPFAQDLDHAWVRAYNVTHGVPYP
jgi:hypothetical protein